MKTLNEMIEVMQSAADGKVIESRLITGMATEFPPQWYRCASPDWNWKAYDYRVKPEPRRWKLHIHDRNPHIASVCVTPAAFESEGYEIVEVVEVLP